MEFPTEVVREGAAVLEVPAIARRRGPGSRSALPFYNPTMSINRDVTVALLASLRPDGPYLDGLAGTGAMGIRAGLEAGVRDVVLNDANPAAADLAGRNAARNRVPVRVECRRLQSLTADERFSHVDVDPFGTPMPYLDAAVQGLARGGRLSVTATDVATLGGVHTRAAFRRYEVRLARSSAIPEVAVRTLLGVVARVAARHDVGLLPLCAFAAEHFVRVHVEIAPSVAQADATLARLGEATPPGGRASIGPLWLGPLGEPSLAEAMEDRVPSARAGRLLAALREEVHLPPFYSRVEDVARASGVAPPPVRSIVDALRGLGFRAARTHFDASAVKTDAPPDELARLLRVVAERAEGSLRSRPVAPPRG